MHKVTPVYIDDMGERDTLVEQTWIAIGVENVGRQYIQLYLMVLVITLVVPTNSKHYEENQ